MKDIEQIRQDLTSDLMYKKSCFEHQRQDNRFRICSNHRPTIVIISSSVAIPMNSSCARCHRTEDQLPEPMKRCTGCRSVLYCSRDCQKLAWKTHKPLCRTAHPGETPPVHSNRTTMSMNYTDFVKMAGGESSGSASNNASSGDDAQTIYYLETSTPHLYDISVSGPYYQLDAIIPQVLRNFGEACLHGQLSIPT